MKKTRDLTILFLMFMFVIPSLAMFSSNNTFEPSLTKRYLQSYDHHDQIWIQSDAEFHAQAAAESWEGDGSAGDPYVITGYLFDCESQPLRIWDTRVHWIFTDNVIDGVGVNIQCGTWIENVTNGAIIDNQVFNRHSGLAISNVADFEIVNNYVHDCFGNGIELFGPMNDTIIIENIVENIGGAGIYSVTSFDCAIKDNVLTNIGGIGIALLGLSPNCNISGNEITNTASSGMMISNADNSYIVGNTISQAIDQGIYLNSPDYCTLSNNIVGNIDGDGIRLASADWCDVQENLIEDCTEDGFLLSSGENTTVQWNTVANTTEYTLHLESATESFSVKYNTFTNTDSTSHVCDDGESNVISHNFYDDWTTPDTDANGFVDTPYIFAGTSGNQDEFPLAVAGVVPTTTITTSTTQTSAAPLPMELILLAGAVGAIVIIAGLLLIKRR